MRYLLIAGFLASPLILLNYFVMPEVQKLQDFYSNIDTYAQKAVATNQTNEQTLARR